LRGDAGLALVHEFMPDAVIVSKDLPQLNGEAVLEHVKRHPETRHLPVYVLAGDDSKLDLRHAGALGCLTQEATPELLGDVFSSSRASSSGARVRCWWWRRTSASETAWPT
jgi:CheY-like chemotaxis protein